MQAVKKNVNCSNLPSNTDNTSIDTLFTTKAWISHTMPQTYLWLLDGGANDVRQTFFSSIISKKTMFYSARNPFITQGKFLCSIQARDCLLVLALPHYLAICTIFKVSLQTIKCGWKPNTAFSTSKSWEYSSIKITNYALVIF